MLFGVALLTQCDGPWWWLETEITFPKIPELPVFRDGTDLFWDVEWWNGGRSNKAEYPADSKRMHLPFVPGGTGTVVVLSTLTDERGEFALLPAGGMFTAGESGGLRWRDGSVTMVVRELLRRGTPLELINADRLYAEAAWRLGADPWLLDRERVTGALLAYRMRASLLTPMETETVTVTVPAGRYRSENALYGVIEAVDVDGRHELVVSVSPGRRHRWWSMDGAVEVLVYCDGAGHCDRHVRIISPRY